MATKIKKFSSECRKGGVPHQFSGVKVNQKYGKGLGRLKDHQLIPGGLGGALRSG